MHGICGRLQPTTAKVPLPKCAAEFAAVRFWLGRSNLTKGEPRDWPPVGRIAAFFVFGRSRPLILRFCCCIVPMPSERCPIMTTSAKSAPPPQTAIDANGNHGPTAPPIADAGRRTRKQRRMSCSAHPLSPSMPAKIGRSLANSITDPIFATSTYTFENTQAVIDFIEQQQPREEYGRYGNPSMRVVERKLAALEGGESALLFSTGMSALAGLLLAKLNAGDEVIFFDECYHRSREFCGKHLSRFGVVTRQVRACDFEAMEAAITPRTRLLISESPTNPHLSIVDLERFAELGRRKRRRNAHRRHARHAVQHPAARRGDRLRDALGHEISRRAQRSAWPACWSARPKSSSRSASCAASWARSTPRKISICLLRGLKTFELRMQRHNENGLAVAEFLAGHPRIERVYYPGLPSHPYHEVARRTMRGFGGLVTFLVRDADWRATARVVDAVKHSAHRPEPGRRRIADRAAAGDELLHVLRRPNGSTGAFPTT